MSDLFSHAAHQPEPKGGPSEPLLFEVQVPVDRQRAFDGFTDGIHLWWPLSEFSAFGAESHVGFEAGTLVEESLEGEQAQWGSIVEWSAPSFLELTWQLGGNPLRPTRLSVEFEGLDAETTLVRLIHSDWPAGPEGARMRERFSEWPKILSRYVRFMGGPAGLD